LVISGVKVTFLNYPFKFNFDVSISGFIKMPDLITLAAIKAYCQPPKLSTNHK